jgi:nanoRNase/pAp phosphatase (c-di-AMP/oligoRNAs hydrolase)
MDQGELTDRDRAILVFEKQWWRHAGSKEQAIRDTFSVSATRYYQMLNALLDNEAALAFEPEVVKRLRRLRTARQSARSGRVNRDAEGFGGGPAGAASNQSQERDHAA